MSESDTTTLKRQAMVLGASVGATLGGLALGLVAWMQSDAPASGESGAGSETATFYGASDAGSVRRKLKQMGLAMHNLHRSFVAPENREGIRNLSWRVHLLPFLDQKPLYRRFKFDEPWDSEHNLKLLELMPDIYKSGDADGALTRFQVLVGPHTLFEEPKKGRLRDCTDGAPHTILVIQAGTGNAVPWTKPHDLTYDPERPIGCIGEVDGGRIECVMADGKPLSVRVDIDPTTFAALATASGNEVVDAPTVRKHHDPPGTFSLLIGN